MSHRSSPTQNKKKSDSETLPFRLIDLDVEPAEAGNLLEHLLRFGRLLRLMGVKVTLSQILELVRAFDVIRITNKRDFYFAARALLMTRREDYLLFDQAFALYWRLPEKFKIGSSKEKDKRPQKLARLPGLMMGMMGASEEDEEEQEITPSYSAFEVLRRKDFSQMTWEEIEQAKAAIAAMEWPISERPTRRRKSGKSGREIDLRRVVRDNLRYGGEPLQLRWRKQKSKPRPLVLLCDISGSMERYTRMLLHFLHTFSHKMGHVETFVFGTRLTRITHHLRHRDVDDALDEVGEVVEDWSGGTKIGETIKTFNHLWVRRVLGQGAVLLVISDGWDRGDTDLLSHEMSRLQRSTYRLIWLNPLLGSEGYQPIQRGMAAALPFVDDFLPVHNLQSLEQLTEAFSRLSTRKAERKQSVKR